MTTEERRVIEGYITRRLKNQPLRDPDYAAGRCVDESVALVEWLEEQGIEATLLSCEGFVGPFKGVASVWWDHDAMQNECRQRCECKTQKEHERIVRREFYHMAVVVGDYVIDLTTTQLGRERDFITRYDEYKRDWRSVQPTD